MSEQTPDATRRAGHPRGAVTMPPARASDRRSSDSSAPVGPAAQAHRLTVWQLLLAALAALAVTALWRQLLPLARPLGDAKWYLQLAGDPSRAVPTPYAYRLFVPSLAHLLGGPPRITLERISFACLAASGPVVYALARRLGAVHWAALLAMLGLLSTRAWTFYLYDPWLTDPAAMLLVAVAFLALVSGRAWLLAPIGMVLAGVRELFVGLLAPAFGWLRGRLGTVRAALAAALLLLPGLVVYQWIVAVTVPSRGAHGLGLVSRQTAVFVWGYVSARGGIGFFAVAAVTLSLGCWWVLAVASLRDPRIWRLLLWLLPVFGQIPLGGDWGRFVLYAFPVVIPAAALTLQRLRPLWRGVAVTVLGLQLLTPLLDLAANRLTLNRPGPAVRVTVVLMAVTAVALAAALMSERRKRPEPVSR